MKIALAQFNPTVGDFAGNTTRILALAERAKERGADLAVHRSQPKGIEAARGEGSASSDRGVRRQKQKGHRKRHREQGGLDRRWKSAFRAEQDAVADV